MSHRYCTKKRNEISSGMKRYEKKYVNKSEEQLCFVIDETTSGKNKSLNTCKGKRKTDTKIIVFVLDRLKELYINLKPGRPSSSRK